MKQGWESKKLGEVAKIGAGNSAPQDKSLFTNGMYPFFRTSDIGKIRIGGVSTAVDLLNDQGIKKLKLYLKGTILLPKSGASTFLNHRVILDVDGFVSSHLATVVCNEDLLDKRFALYYLIGIKAQDLIQDHSYPSLKLSDIKEIPIPIPPLEEQKQIVAKLDQCFEAIDKARANAAKNLENAKELFQSKLNDIFSQKGEGWVKKKLGDAYDVRDGTHDSPKYQDNGFPLITSKNLKNGLITLDKIKYISEDDYLSINKRSKVDVGDILFAMIGTIGNPVVIRDNPGFSIKNVALFKVSKNNDSDFLRYYLEYSTRVMKDEAKGTTQKFVGLGYLRNFTIPLPDLDVQKKVVYQLNRLNKQTQSLESKYQQELNSLEELKKSILQKAFEGEL